MRTTTRIIQVFVSLLFIVSGLVKANDPLGLSYKMQEFFELWNSELEAGRFFLKSMLVPLFTFLHDHSLALSIFMITLEIAAGIALLMAWKKNFILSLLSVLIVFFTFLTGYAYGSGKFTNCGCFGDCLPITPLTSFIKDLLLLLLILILIFGRRHLRPLFGGEWRGSILAISTILSLILQWYVLSYLPIADCLPFKKGINISAKMKPPPGAVPDSFAIRFIYEKQGRRFEFSPDELPADFNTYKFIDRQDKLIRKGNAEPAIKGFALSGVTGIDSTEAVLTQPKAVMIFMQQGATEKEAETMSPIIAAAKEKNLPVYLLSGSAADAMKLTKGQAQCFNCDFTIIRTAARTPLCYYLLKNGTIISKHGNRETEKVLGEIRSEKF